MCFILAQYLFLFRLAMIVDKLPSPLEVTEERAEKLLCSKARRFDSLPQQTQKLKQSMLSLTLCT